MTDDNVLIPLPHVSRALQTHGFTDQPVSYNRLYQLLLSNSFPAELINSNRWGVRPSHFTEVVAALGLKAPSAKPVRARRAVPSNPASVAA